MMSRSVFSSCAASSERTATLAGSVPDGAVVTGMSKPRAPRLELLGRRGAKGVRRAEAHRCGLPSARAQASFAAVVVLPLPFTPMSRIVSGFCRTGSGGGMRTSAAIFSRSHCLRFFRLTREAGLAQFALPLVGERDAEIGLDQQRFPVDLVPAAKAVDQLIPKSHAVYACGVRLAA